MPNTLMLKQAGSFQFTYTIREVQSDFKKENNNSLNSSLAVSSVSFDHQPFNKSWVNLNQNIGFLTCKWAWPAV